MINSCNFPQSDILIEGKYSLSTKYASFLPIWILVCNRAWRCWSRCERSGKTSLLRIIAGFLPISGGSLKRPETSSLYHYIGHQNALKKQKTVMENLSFWATFHGNGMSSISPADILQAAGIDSLVDIRTAALSSGQQRRLALRFIAAASNML